MIGAPLMTKRSPLKVRSSGAPNYPVARWSKKSVAWSLSSIILTSPNICNFDTQRILLSELACARGSCFCRMGHFVTAASRQSYDPSPIEI